MVDTCVHHPPCSCLCKATCCLNSPLKRCILDQHGKIPNPKVKGTYRRGVDRKTPDKYRAIAQARQQGLKAVEVAAVYNVTVRTVYRAIKEYSVYSS